MIVWLNVISIYKYIVGVIGQKWGKSVCNRDDLASKNMSHHDDRRTNAAGQTNKPTSQPTHGHEGS